MKDELTMLKEWIAEQREIYRNSNFESDDKKLDEIKRQLVLQEITLQILVFEKLTSDAVIESWGKAPKNNTSVGVKPANQTGSKSVMIGNYTPPDYMLISPDLRKQLDEAAENKIVKS